MAVNSQIDNAVQALQQGRLIAYPTESVYGLGCDPQQAEAIEALIKLKQRNPDKGLILIASKFEQLLPFIDDIDSENARHAKSQWPCAITWVWPKKKGIHSLISGQHETVAVRVTAHPVAAALCEAFQGAIISTSANPEGQAPAKTANEVIQYFPSGISTVVDAEVGELLQPTPIYDVITKAEIRT